MWYEDAGDSLEAPSPPPPPAPSPPAPEAAAVAEQVQPKKKKRRGCCCCCLLIVLLPVVLTLAFVVFAYLYMGRDHPVLREWERIPDYYDTLPIDAPTGGTR